VDVIGSREIAAGVEPAHRNGKAATSTEGLAHDVSILPGVGRHLVLANRGRGRQQELVFFRAEHNQILCIFMAASVRNIKATGPPISTYDPWVLSADERKRFIAALGDGFGFSHKRRELDEQPLPTTITPGLLQHRVYYDPFRRIDDFSGEEVCSSSRRH
jgi:hypothetical protein